MSDASTLLCSLKDSASADCCANRPTSREPLQKAETNRSWLTLLRQHADAELARFKDVPNSLKELLRGYDSVAEAGEALIQALQLKVSGTQNAPPFEAALRTAEAKWQVAGKSFNRQMLESVMEAASKAPEAVAGTMKRVFDEDLKQIEKRLFHTE